MPDAPKFFFKDYFFLTFSEKYFMLTIFSGFFFLIDSMYCWLQKYLRYIFAVFKFYIISWSGPNGCIQHIDSHYRILSEWVLMVIWDHKLLSIIHVNRKSTSIDYLPHNILTKFYKLIIPVNPNLQLLRPESQKFIKYLKEMKEMHELS